MRDLLASVLAVVFVALILALALAVLTWLAVVVHDFLDSAAKPN